MTRLVGNPKSSAITNQMMRMAMEGRMVQWFAFTRHLSFHGVTSDEIPSALLTVMMIQFLSKSGEFNSDRPILAPSVLFGNTFFLKYP